MDDLYRLLGSSLLSKKSGSKEFTAVSPAEGLDGADYVGIYFSAHVSTLCWRTYNEAFAGQHCGA